MTTAAGGRLQRKIKDFIDRDDVPCGKVTENRVQEIGSFYALCVGALLKYMLG